MYSVILISGIQFSDSAFPYDTPCSTWQALPLMPIPHFSHPPTHLPLFGLSFLIFWIQLTPYHYHSALFPSFPPWRWPLNCSEAVVTFWLFYSLRSSECWWFLNISGIRKRGRSRSFEGFPRTCVVELRLYYICVFWSCGLLANVKLWVVNCTLIKVTGFNTKNAMCSLS